MHKPITIQQQEYIKCLVCERMSANPDNLRNVDGFVNIRNHNLVNTIQNEANEQDEDGEVAYYIVRDPEYPNIILCYFSLKTGILFDKIGELELLEAKKKLFDLVKKRKAIHPSPELALISKDIDSQISKLKIFLKKEF